MKYHILLFIGFLEEEKIIEKIANVKKHNKSNMNNNYLINEAETLINYFQELEDIYSGTFVYNKEKVPLSPFEDNERDMDIYLSNAFLYLLEPKYSNFQKYLSIAFNYDYNEEETRDMALGLCGKMTDDPALKLMLGYFIRFKCLAEHIGKNHPELDIMDIMDDLLPQTFSSALILQKYLNENVEENKRTIILRGVLEKQSNISDDILDDEFQDNEINKLIKYRNQSIDSMIKSYETGNLNERIRDTEVIIYFIKFIFDRYKHYLHQQEYNMIDAWYKIINIDEEEAKTRLLNVLPDIPENILGITDLTNNESKNNVFSSSEKVDVDEWFGEIDEFFDDYMKIRQLAERLSEEGYFDKSSIETFILRVSGYKTTEKVNEFIRWRGEDKDLYFLHKLLLGRFEGFKSYHNRNNMEWKNGKLKEFFKGPDYINCNTKCNRLSKGSKLKPILKDIFGLEVQYRNNKGNISIKIL